MSGENLVVQYEQFRESARGFDQIAYGLSAVRERIDARMRAEGKCWGSDETGSTFEHGYLPGAEDTLSALNGAVNKVHGTAENIRQNAEAYLATEQRFHGRLSGVEGAGLGD